MSRLSKFVRSTGSLVKHWRGRKVPAVSPPPSSAQSRGNFIKGQFAAELTVYHFEEHPTVGGEASFKIELCNTGLMPWRDDMGTRLFLRWLAMSEPGSEIVLSESHSLPLPALIPGETKLVEGSVPVSINSVLDVTIEFNLRDANGDWLAPASGAASGVRNSSRHASHPAFLTRHVGGQNALNVPAMFEYEDFYRGFDLEKDWWTVVGPATREEFEMLGQAKCKSLLEQGLSPDSKVLDVGCGTGQLTGPISDVLGPAGLYYGTDVADTAIDFCKRKFRLSNFHFVKNDNASIPIEGLEFDFIYLGSVFTHMYPDDIHKMLEDLRRLMAQTGCVMADAFVSPDIETFIGNRSMIQLNENNLIDSFHQRGFRHTEHASTPWNEHCRRVVYKLQAA